jgi:hypothetical protein
MRMLVLACCGDKTGKGKAGDGGGCISLTTDGAEIGVSDDEEAVDES